MRIVVDIHEEMGCNLEGESIKFPIHQDGVPIRWGQVFRSYATAVRKGRKIIERSRPILEEVAIGGSAAGTGLNTHRRY